MGPPGPKAGALVTSKSGLKALYHTTHTGDNQEMNRLLPILLLPSLALASPQAVLRWQADASSPAPEPFVATVLQGESIGLECRLQHASIPAGATASFLWQTNGMASAWWETNATVTVSNGTVRADWTPAMDCGAASYSFFLRVSASGSALYRAYGTLRMRPSPGATPNALPMPPTVLDFNSVTWENAPWATMDDVNSAIDAIPPGVSEADIKGLIDSQTGGTNILAHTDDNGNLVVRDRLVLFPYGTSLDGYNILFPYSGFEGERYVTTADIDDYDSGLPGRVYEIANSQTNYLSVADGSLTVVSGTNAVWSSAEAGAGLEERVEALEARIEEIMASWGDYDAQGNPNPIDDTVIVNRAYATLMSGFRWVSSGGVFALATSGSVAYAAEGNGSLRIYTESVSNYVGIVQGGMVTVGCQTDGISVDDGVVSLVYSWTGGDHPIIWASSTVMGVYEVQTGVTWIDDADAGTATALLPEVGDAMFFKATTSVQSATYWAATMPSYFGGGIKTSSQDLDPVVYDSKVEITQGGRTYRIPAQEVTP